MNADAAYPNLFPESNDKLSAKQTLNTARECAGWINLGGIVARCSEPVTRNRNDSRRYHSRECATRTEVWRERGLNLGDSILPQPRPCKGWIFRDGLIAECGGLFTPKRRSTATAHGECAKRKANLLRRGFSIGDRHRRKLPEKPAPKPCIGWAVRDGAIVMCDEPFVRSRGTATGHAECVQKRQYLIGQGFNLGDPYPREREARKLGPCTGWIIRDGLIEQCGASRTDFESHKSCFTHKTQWAAVGYTIGVSVRRVCAYRKCASGENGGKKIFDRTKQSRTGDYYCSGSHNSLETLARKADKIAAMIAELERRAAEADRILAQPKGGRDPEDEIAEKIDPLYKQGVKWPFVKKQLDSTKNGFRSADAYRKLYGRWLGRKKTE